MARQSAARGTWTTSELPRAPRPPEVLSPGTQRTDRMKKMPIYAREKVGHVWLVDPVERTVEVFRHEESSYVLVGTFGGDAAVRAEPFDAVEISPAYLWGRQSAG